MISTLFVLVFFIMWLLLFFLYSSIFIFYSLFFFLHFVSFLSNESQIEFHDISTVKYYIIVISRISQHCNSWISQKLHQIGFQSIVNNLNFAKLQQVEFRNIATSWILQYRNKLHFTFVPSWISLQWNKLNFTTLQQVEFIVSS